MSSAGMEELKTDKTGEEDEPKQLTLALKGMPDEEMIWFKNQIKDPYLNK